MKILIIATHSFPLADPNLNSNLENGSLHTGDHVISGLADSLTKLGNEVSVCAPAFSWAPYKLFEMRASYGQYPPSAQDCELECLNKYYNDFSTFDIIHDFSVGKSISHYFANLSRPVIQTLMGGAWTYGFAPTNLCTWSQTHKYRVENGFTDYYGTKTPNIAGSGIPVKQTHVVNGGINTSFFTPNYKKDDYFLYLSRWHDARGYQLAIESAKQTGIKLIMAGEHPDNEKFEYQRNCALNAIEMSKGYSNIQFHWLPKTNPYHHLTKLKLYQNAKALLNPIQVCEPFGLSMPESLACGTPVITTNYGSTTEIIKNNQTGFTVNNDLNDFVDAIYKVDELNLELCRTEAVNRFDLSIMAENYTKEYLSVINGSSW